MSPLPGRGQQLGLERTGQGRSVAGRWLAGAPEGQAGTWALQEGFPTTSSGLSAAVRPAEQRLGLGETSRSYGLSSAPDAIRCQL